MAKNIKRDLLVLGKIVDIQTQMMDVLKSCNIHNEASFINQAPITKRGLAAMASDIYELTNALRDETVKEIGFNKILIREFRNAATHNYGELSSRVAYISIDYCTSKDLMKNMQYAMDLFKSLLNRPIPEIAELYKQRGHELEQLGLDSHSKIYKEFIQIQEILSEHQKKSNKIIENKDIENINAKEKLKDEIE